MTVCVLPSPDCVRNFPFGGSVAMRLISIAGTSGDGAAFGVAPGACDGMRRGETALPMAPPRNQVKAATTTAMSTPPPANNVPANPATMPINAPQDCPALGACAWGAPYPRCVGRPGD